MFPMSSVVLCLVGVVTLVSGLSIRVPAPTCEDLSPQVPGQDSAPPQNSPVPFDFVLDHTKISSSEKLEFTIRSEKGLVFTAFMVQVRDDKSATPLKPLGTFQPKDSTFAQAVTCSADNDTISHNYPDPKNNITLIWTPPTDYKGQVTFYATVAESKEKYWVRQKAGIVDVE